MANDQGPGFVDKHVEKIVLAVCGLILIYAVVQYGISTPRRVDAVKGGDPVAPAEVDSILLTEARRVLDLVKDESSPEPPELIYVKIFKELETNPLSEKLASLSFGPPLGKGLGYGGAVDIKPPTLAGIIKVIPAPHKPVNWYESELVNVSREKNEIELEENPTWRSVTYYPWGELSEAWKKELKDSVIYPQITAIGYEVEIEEKQPDGTWKVIDSVNPVYRPDSGNFDKTGKEMFPPRISPYQVEDDGTDNAAEITEAIRKVDSFTESQLQPDYFDVWTSQGQGVWQKHMPLETITEWYEGKWETPEDGAEPAKVPERGGVAAAPGFDPGMDPMDIIPSRRRTGRKAVARRRLTTAGSKFLPDYATQLEAGKVLAWFHSNKIQYGHEYRCRFRLIFVNPLLMSVDDVDKSKPDDAKIPTVTTKWSPWSDSVEVTRDMQFFVTGSSTSSKTFSATIFTKVLGQLVSWRCGHIGVGEPIGGTAQVAVTNPATGETEEPQIEFNTGAIAVSLNFQKEVVVLAGARSYTKKTTEVIYIDQDGKLHSRVMYDDKRDETYREMSEEVKDKAPMTDRDVQRERRRLERLEKKRKKAPAGSDLGPAGFPPAPR